MYDESGIRPHSLGDTRRYIPEWSNGLLPQMLSHETVCILNTSDRDAQVEITIYFSDREPAGPYRFTVPARRTLHQRFNDLTDPEPIPHTRLDSRQAENALISTIAYPAG